MVGAVRQSPVIWVRWRRRNFPLHQRSLLCHSRCVRRISHFEAVLLLAVSSRSDHISLAQKRRRRSLARGRLTLFMGLFGVAFILLTFGYIAWEQRNRLIQRNEDDLAERRLLPGRSHGAAPRGDGPDAQTDHHPGAGTELGSRSKPRRPLWQQIHAIQDALPYIEDIWLNDPSGRLRLTSAQFPPPDANASGRDAFSAQASEDQGLFVGEPMLGRVTKVPTFMISRRLAGARMRSSAALPPSPSPCPISTITGRSCGCREAAGSR